MIDPQIRRLSNGLSFVVYPGIMAKVLEDELVRYSQTLIESDKTPNGNNPLSNQAVPPNKNRAVANESL